MRNITFGERYQSSLLHRTHDDSIFLFHIKSSVCDTNRWWESFHVESVFDRDWNTKQRVQKLVNLLLRIIESPVTFLGWLPDFIALLCQFDGIVEVDFCDKVQSQPDGGCTPTVNGSQLFRGDFLVVEFIDDLLQRQTSGSVDGVLCDIFWSDDFLEWIKTFLDGLMSLLDFSLSDIF